MSESTPISKPLVLGDFYEDEYLRIDTGGVHIKWYFFPFGTKHISWAEMVKIEALRDLNNAGVLTTKSWGTALSPIWWACDMKRQFRKETQTLLFDVVDDSLRKATTVADLESAMRVISKLSPIPVQTGSKL